MTDLKFLNELANPNVAEQTVQKLLPHIQNLKKGTSVRVLFLLKKLSDKKQSSEKKQESFEELIKLLDLSEEDIKDIFGIDTLDNEADQTEAKQNDASGQQK